MDNIISQLIAAKNEEIRNLMVDFSKNMMYGKIIFNNRQIVELGKTVNFRQQNVVFVGWEDGKISIMPYNPGIDNIISLPFSGCLMGTFTFRNWNYAVHISTSEDPTKDRRVDWKNFCEYYSVMNIKIFQPNKYLKTEEKYNSVWGIISNTGNCYSAGIGRNNNIEDYRCFIIEQAVRTFDDALGYTNLYREWQFYNSRIIEL